MTKISRMFRWIGRKLSNEQPDSLPSISSTGKSFWEVTAPRDLAAFVRQLPELLPEGSILYLEGAGISRAVCGTLEALAVEAQEEVYRGTMWPRPKTFHIPMTAENIDCLAGLFETRVAIEICEHFHAYKEGLLLLEWYDACSGDSFAVSGSTSEQSMKRFCEHLECEYETECIDS